MLYVEIDPLKITDIKQKILGWKNTQKVNTFNVFIHLILLSDNHGGLVTSISTLSEETGFSVQMIRTALDHLVDDKMIIRQTVDKTSTRIFIIEIKQFYALSVILQGNRD